MSSYRRAFCPGGTFFFTLVTEGRRAILTEEAAREALHNAFAECRKVQPFELVASVLLPDHLHTIWRLPEGDSDFSLRWSRIKARFTSAYLAAGGEEAARPASRVKHRRRGVWQRRFGEHLIRDQADFNNHVDYIHYNPVKHGHATCPHAWPWSSFHRWQAAGFYEKDWRCACDGRPVEPPPAPQTTAPLE